MTYIYMSPLCLHFSLHISCMWLLLCAHTERLCLLLCTFERILPCKRTENWVLGKEEPSAQNYLHISFHHSGNIKCLFLPCEGMQLCAFGKILAVFSLPLTVTLLLI